MEFLQYEIYLGEYNVANLNFNDAEIQIFSFSICLNLKFEIQILEPRAKL